MFRANKPLAWFWSYIGAEGGYLRLLIGAGAARIRMGVSWWMGCILVALLLVLPNFMPGKLSKIWLQFPGLDKPTHFVAFIMVFLIAYAVLCDREWPVSERGKLGVAVGFALGASLADEAQQAVLGMGRTAEYGDLVADAAGVLVGLTVVNAERLGMKRAVGIVALLVVPVVLVTARTYHDRKHLNRGLMFEREHDYQRARAEYMLAIDSGFQTAELYNTIAWLDIEFLNADPIETLGYANRAFAMEPDNPDILDTYGWVLVQAGRPREALPFLERANRMRPSIYCINVHLGVAYMKAGDRNRASDHLKRQIELNAVDRWGRSAQLALDELRGSAG